VKDNPTERSSATFGEDTEPLATLAQRYEYAERLTPRLLAAARRMLPPHEDPRDFVQETLARVHKSPDDLTADHFDAWLFTTLRRVIIDAHRRQPTAEELARVAYAEPPAEPDLAERVCDRAEAVWLDRQADRVVPEKRRAVVHVFKAGGGVAAVADELGTSYVIAQNEVARTRRPLRDALMRSRHVTVIPGVRALRLRRLVRRIATGAALAPAFVVTTAVLLTPTSREPSRAAPPRLAPMRVEAVAMSRLTVGRLSRGPRAKVPMPPRRLPPLPNTDRDFAKVNSCGNCEKAEAGSGGHTRGQMSPTDFAVACVHHFEGRLDEVGCSMASPSPSH
jgi:RNA polymerase sigma-70 factor (ECF subfamily)